MGGLDTLFGSVGAAGESGGVSGNQIGSSETSSIVSTTSNKVKSGNIKVGDSVDWTSLFIVAAVVGLIVLKKV